MDQMVLSEDEHLLCCGVRGKHKEDYYCLCFREDLLCSYSNGVSVSAGEAT